MENTGITEVAEVIEKQSFLADLFTRQRIAQLVASLIVVALAIVVWIVASRAYRRVARKRQGIVPAEGRIGTITSVVLNIMKGAIILVVVIIVLEINGIKVTSLLAGVGIASAIVGLALQDYLKDVIMGAHIISDDFFQVGEVIRYGAVEGVVTSFNLRTTKLALLSDGSVMTISNRNISEITKLGNRLYLDMPLAYGHDTVRANEVLNWICREIEERFPDAVLSCSNLGVGEMADSAVLYKIQLVCLPEKKLGARREAIAALYGGVTEAGLEIPFSQVDVHMK